MQHNIFLKLVITIIFILFISVFTVTEGQKAIVLRLGKLVVNSKTNQAEVLTPGIHFKLPLIEAIRFFDSRVQTLDINHQE